MKDKRKNKQRQLRCRRGGKIQKDLVHFECDIFRTKSEIR